MNIVDLLQKVTKGEDLTLEESMYLLKFEENVRKEQEATMNTEQNGTMPKERIGEKIGAAIGIGINRTGKAINAGYMLSKAYTQTVVIPVVKKAGSELKAETKGFFTRLKEEAKR